MVSPAKKERFCREKEDGNESNPNKRNVISTLSPFIGPRRSALFAAVPLAATPQPATAPQPPPPEAGATAVGQAELLGFVAEHRGEQSLLSLAIDAVRQLTGGPHSRQLPKGTPAHLVELDLLIGGAQSSGHKQLYEGHAYVSLCYVRLCYVRSCSLSVTVQTQLPPLSFECKKAIQKSSPLEHTESKRGSKSILRQAGLVAHLTLLARDPSGWERSQESALMLAELHLDAASAPANKGRGPAKPASKGRPASEEGAVTRSHMQVWSPSPAQFSIPFYSTQQCADRVMSKLSTRSHPASHSNMHAAELPNDMYHPLKG